MHQTKAGRTLRTTALGALTLAVMGCSSFSADGGFGSVEQVARERLNKDLAWTRTEEQQQSAADRVSQLLGKPLSADDAVQIALLNNKGLQASFSELGISEASVVQAGRLPNPHFAMTRTSLIEGGVRHYSIEQSLTINVLALLTMPQLLSVERRRFDQVQRTTAIEVLRIASEARKAYLSAVAAEQSMRYMRDVNEVAELGADLARRMREVGNWNALLQAREQAFYADATLSLARAEQVRISTRERLTRLLGLSGSQTEFQLPDRLPDLPSAPTELPDAEQRAMTQRLDLQAIRIETDALARNLGLSRATRFINVLELGPARERDGPSGAPWSKGYEISFDLPIFDFGTAKVARAEAIYMQAVNRGAQAAVNARSEVREAYLAYRSGFDVARHYRDEIVPLRKRISDETLLRYNGMLIGVFELLADARGQIASVNGSIDALRDFWIAEADLDMAMIGPSSMNPPRVASAPSGGDAGLAH